MTRGNCDGTQTDERQLQTGALTTNRYAEQTPLAANGTSTGLQQINRVVALLGGEVVCGFGFL